MKFWKDIVSRIRWEVVISAAVLIGFAVIAIFFIRPFNPQYNCSDDVCMSTRMDPDAIGLKGDSKLWVDLRNDGSDDLKIDVHLKTRNPALYFQINGDTHQETNRTIELGAGETMRINFNVRSRAEYPGTYRTDVTIQYRDVEPITDDVYLRVG